MTSSINPSLIDPTFPVANKNQSSQGFRTNFAGIQTNFSYAKNEITTLQGTTIVISGDVSNSGPAPSLSQPSPFQIPLAISLVNTLNSSATFDTSSQDVSLAVDEKGRITSVDVTNKTTYDGDTTPKITVIKNTTDVDYPDDTGIASVTMPVFTIGKYGAVESSTSFTINDFGLLGYSMPKATLMAGSNLNKSKYVPSYTTYSDYNSKETYILVSDPNQETGIKWENISTKMSNTVSASNGIENTSSTGVSLSLTTSNITEKKSLGLTDRIFVSNLDSAETINYSSLSDFKTFFDGYYIGSVFQDKSPKLSNNLDMNGHGLTSAGDLTITAPSIHLGSVQYQVVPPPSNGLLLTFNTDGTTKYSSLSDFKTFFDRYYLGSVFQDKSPKLSNNLDMNGHGLTSAEDLTITAPSVHLGKVQYQIVPPPSNGLLLSFNTDGTTKYVNIDSISSSVANGRGLGEYTNGGTKATTLYLDYSNMPSSTVDSYYDTKFTVLKGSNTILVSLKDLFPVSEIYVDPSNGNDTYDGSLVFPVKTITKALTLGTNINLMPGIYKEDINITRDNTNIVSTGGCTIFGIISITTNLTSFRIEGVKFNYTEGKNPISVTGLVTNLTLQNCDIVGSHSDTILDFSSLPAYSNVYLIDCHLTGIVQNSHDGNVYITGYSIPNSGLSISNTGNGSFYVSDLDVLLSVNHTSGNVHLSNITSLYDSYHTSTKTINGTIVTLSPSLISTSTNVNDLIVLDNVNLYNFQTKSFSQINQTGTCRIQFNKVLRDVQNDVISGKIISPDFFYSDSSRVKYQTISSDATLDSDTEWHQLNITDNSTVSISSPNYSISPYVVKKKYILMSGNGDCTLDVVNKSGFDNVYVGGSNRCLYTLMWDTVSSNWEIIDSSYITSTSNYTKNINTLELGGTGKTKSISANGSVITFEDDKITFSTSPVFSGLISESVSSNLMATGTDFNSALALKSQINDVTSVAGSNTVKTYTYPSTLYDKDISGFNYQVSTSGSGTDFEGNVTSSKSYFVNNLTTTSYGSGYKVKDVLTTNYGTLTITGVSDGTDTSISTGTPTITKTIFTSDPAGYKVASSGGSGSGASFDVTSESNLMYVPSEVTIDNAGSGYKAKDTITIEDVGTITVETVGSKGEILTISSILDKTPQIEDMSDEEVTGTTNGSGNGASFNVTSTSRTYYTITGITLNDVGIGYKVTDVLTVGDSYGTFTVTALQKIPAGGITSYTFSSNKTEYTTDQTGDPVTITNNTGSGTGASFKSTSDIKYRISSISITNSGSGYAIGDTITLNSGVSITVTDTIDESSVSLPSVANGTTITISNRTGVDIYVYPNSTEQIESEAIGSAVIVSNDSTVKFIKITETLWRT